METAISRIGIFDMDKQQVHNFVQQASQEALDYDYDLLKIKRQLKILTDIVKGIENNLELHILDEAEKNGDKFIFEGAEFQVKTRNSYDFTGCNDKLLQEAEEIVKKRKAMLKNLDNEMADPQTGEILKPPITKQTSFITVKL